MTAEQERQYAGQSITCTTCQKPFAVGGTPPQPPVIPQPPSGAPIPGQMDYARPMATPKTDGWSIASLVCGCLVCVPLVPGLLATIFGIIGITRTSSPAVKGRGFAIAGLVLGVLNLLFIPVLMISILLPSLNRARETANRVKCASNMRQIGQALLLYANENRGDYPPDLETLLLTQDIGADVFCCPSSNDEIAPGATVEDQATNLSAGGHLSYVYLGSEDGSSTSAEQIVLYEPITNHGGDGGNALFGDGHVEFLNKQMLQKTLADTEAEKDSSDSTQLEAN